MANRKKQKQKMKSSPVERRRPGMMEIISIAISLLALTVSVFVAFSSEHYAKMEYAYKLDPKIEVSGRIEAAKNPNGGEPLTAMKDFRVRILEENNLKRAYVIYADERVEVLELDNMEGRLEGTIEGSLSTPPDIVVGEWAYRYFFVYLESLDGSGNLHLIYTKSSPGEIEFYGVAGIEVYGLGKGNHEDENAYIGEGIMRQEYARILKELPEYLG